MNWECFRQNIDFLPIHTKKTNGFGLYDTVGNVSEIVLDYYPFENFIGYTNPWNNEYNSNVMRRGGDYGASPNGLELYHSSSLGIFSTSGDAGFRLVRKAP